MKQSDFQVFWASEIFFLAYPACPLFGFKGNPFHYWTDCLIFPGGDKAFKGP